MDQQDISKKIPEVSKILLLKVGLILDVCKLNCLGTQKKPELTMIEEKELPSYGTVPLSNSS